MIRLGASDLQPRHSQALKGALCFCPGLTAQGAAELHGPKKSPLSKGIASQDSAQGTDGSSRADQAKAGEQNAFHLGVANHVMDPAN